MLGLLALGVTPFVFYSTTFYADRIEPRLYKVRGLEGMNMAIAHEAMSMMRVVLAFGRGPSEWKRWRDQGEESVVARVDLTVRQTAFKLAVQLITAVGTAAVLGLGAYLAIEGRISPGELTVVLTYIAQVYAPVEQLTQTVAAYQQHFIAFRHAYDLLQVEPEVDEKPDARAIDRVRGALKLEDVHFGYGDRGDALKGVTFEVDPGRGGGGRRPHRSRQVDPREPAAALLRSAGGPGADRRRGRGRPDPRLAAGAVQHRPPGAAAVLDQHQGQHQVRPPGRNRQGSRGGGARGQRPRLHHEAARMATAPGWGSAGRGSPAASASA